MKRSVMIFLGVLTALAGCSSQKKLEKSAPFVITSTTCESWPKGNEGNSAGHTVKIHLSQMNAGDVELQNIYFRGQMSGVIMDMEDQGMVASAKFESLKPDTIMHADSRREVGIQPPKIRKNRKTAYSFELREDEAVLSYFDNEKLKYVKVPGVITITAATDPDRQPN